MKTVVSERKAGIWIQSGMSQAHKVLQWSTPFKDRAYLPAHPAGLVVVQWYANVAYHWTNTAWTLIFALTLLY